MKKKFVSIMLIFALVMSSFTFMSDEANAARKVWKEYNPDRYGDITKTAALRSKSSSKSKSLGTISKGKRVQLYGYDKYASGSWYKVKYGKKKGYVYAKKVKLSYKAYAPAHSGTTTANLYMRSGVGLNYSKKIYIKSGSKVILHGYYRTVGYDWYKISYGGKTGYASSKYIKRNKLSTGPVINKFITTTSYVKIFWKEAKHASIYEIHRKEESGKYKKIATVNDNILQYVDKKIKVGKSYTYKIVSRNGNKRYESIGRKVTPIKIAAPKLKHVKRYTSSGHEKVQFNWQAKKGAQYYVYKKTVNGSWNKLATVNATSSIGTYTDNNIEAGVDYIYTAKEVRKIGEILYKYSEYDSGIMTIANKAENIKVDAGTLNAKVTWDKVDGATSYKVYRKIGRTGDYRLLATVKNNEFTDVYYNNAKTDNEKSYLCATYFTDPSINPYVYTVRAFNNNRGKESYSDYYRDGDFHIENPAIISVKKNDDNTATYEWSNPVNPVGYILYSGIADESGKVNWTKVSEVSRKSGGRLKATVEVDPSHDYFTIQAKYEKEGQYVYSEYDEGYTIKNKKYSDNNILYLGDSITYGSPYKTAGATKEVYSYPYRVQQLTGVNTCNPSIPGSTWCSDPYDKFRYSMTKDVADQIAQGKSVSSRVPENETVHKNTDGKTFADFDVVVLAAGTNDYSSITQLGDLNSTNDVEFNGALNKIMNYIQEANVIRKEAQKDPIKVVFVELFYSDRTEPMHKITNRFVTKNAIGLTLVDYQNCLNAQAAKWRENGLDVYNFDTTKFVDETTCKYNTSDNLHMNRFTYTQIGNELAQFMIDNNIIK